MSKSLVREKTTPRVSPLDPQCGAGLGAWIPSQIPMFTQHLPCIPIHSADRCVAWEIKSTGADFAEGRRAQVVRMKPVQGVRCQFRCPTRSCSRPGT